MAKDPKYSDVQFLSICCDKLDGARSIIERDDDLRWQNVAHYFMEKSDKEEAKKMLGFKSVPFYVVLDENGAITQLGNEKNVNFDEVPGVVAPPPPPKQQENLLASSFGQLQIEESKVASSPVSPVQVDRVFNMDDLDF